MAIKFKDIPGFPDYQVSKYGDVRSVEREREEFRNGKWQTRRYKSKIIKPNLHKPSSSGYYKVQLCYGLDCRFYVSVHKLVMLAWGKDFDPRTKILFKIKSKYDYSYTNLKQTDIDHGRH